MKSNLTRCVAAVAAAVIIATVAVAGRHSSSGSAGVALPGCTPRLIVLDQSSSARSARNLKLAFETTLLAAESALVCEKNLQVFAVASGVTSLVLADRELASLGAVGPSPQIRKSRLKKDKIAKLVQTTLRASLASSDPHSTSIPAIWKVIAEHAVDETAVIIITDGVQNDVTGNLNRPLTAGDGEGLAQSLDIQPVRAASITIGGVGQVDRTKSSPGPSWITEIAAFITAIAEAGGGPDARVYTTDATPSEMLREDDRS